MTETIKKKIYKTLKWSEQFMKMDMLYVARTGSWVTFGQTLNSILSFLLIIALANLLPKETYGYYQYILSLAGVLNIFTLTGMNSAVLRTVARGNDEVFRPSVVYQHKWNILLFIAFMALSGYYAWNEDMLFAISFLLLGFFVPSTFALNTYGAYLEGRKEFKLVNIASVTSTFIYVVGILIATIFSGEVLSLVFAYAITTFLPTVLFYLYVIHKYNPPKVGDAKETLAYGRRLSFIKLIGPIASQIDKILLAHFWGPAQLATYSIALVIPNRAIPFLKKFIAIGFPKFASKTAAELNTVFYRRIVQGLLIGGVTALAYILVSPFMFKYLLPQYLEGVFYSQILAVTFLFAMPTRYVSYLFESQKMAKQILFTSIGNGLMAILLFILLGIWGGLIGLVIAKVLHSFFGLLVLMATWRTASKATA